MPPSPETEQSFLQIEGQIEPEDRQLILGILGRFGLHANFIADVPGTIPVLTQPESIKYSQQVETIKANGYRFEDITRPDDVLFREHFEDLARQPGSVNPKTMTRVFHALIDSGNKTRIFGMQSSDSGSFWVQTREPQPLAGIEIIDRVANKFPLSSLHLVQQDARILAHNYGMNSLSVLKGLNSALQTTHTTDSKTRAGMMQVRERLSEQLGYSYVY